MQTYKIKQNKFLEFPKMTNKWFIDFHLDFQPQITYIPYNCQQNIRMTPFRTIQFKWEAFAYYVTLFDFLCSSLMCHCRHNLTKVNASKCLES